GRDREARDDRRRQVAQEQEDDQDDQGDREEERELDVVDRLADRDGTVVENVQVHRRRQFRAEVREQRPDRVHDLHGVRPRLALDGQNHSTLVIVPARDLVDLHAVDHAPELLEPDGMIDSVQTDKITSWYNDERAVILTVQRQP